MRSWRIAIEEAALDRSCEGALKSCGHWHEPGRVPSTIVQEATNLVINPMHRDYDKVRLQVVRSFSFDPRMFKR